MPKHIKIKDLGVLPERKEYCNECPLLEPKEKHQKPKEFHICQFLNKQIKHNGKHPLLPIHKDCPMNLWNQCREITGEKELGLSVEKITKVLTEHYKDTILTKLAEVDFYDIAQVVADNFGDMVEVVK